MVEVATFNEVSDNQPLNLQDPSNSLRVINANPSLGKPVLLQPTIVEVNASCGPSLPSPTKDSTANPLQLARPQGVTELDGPPAGNLTHGDTMEVDTYCDPSKPPSNLSLPPNFKWVYIHGIWTLVPTKFSIDITSRSSYAVANDSTENLEI